MAAGELAGVTNSTLGGERLLAIGRVGWSLISGTDPHIRTFEMEAGAAQRVLAQTRSGQTLELSIEVPGRVPLKIQKLYALSGGPSAAHPQILEVLVADRRWLLPRLYVERVYNLRRRTGERRILREGDAPEQLAQVVDDVHFAAWSLFPRDNPTTRWSARNIVADVLERLVPGDWEIAPSLSREIDVEGLLISDPGPAALRRALGLLPGADVYVNETGKYVVYDRRDGGEETVLGNADPPISGPLLTRKSDLRLSRPKRVRVRTVPELELRLDSRSEGGTVTEDTREIENVLPVPDFQLTMADGRIVPQGSWERVDDVLTAWTNDVRPGQTVVLSHDIIQRAWFNGGFFQAFVQLAGIEPDLILARRVAAIYEHYRQTWRVDRRMMDRIASLQAVRVGILDAETATRAPAVVYGDWTVIYTLRGGVSEQTRQLSRFADTFDGYATSLADARIAPAVVSILDPEQGIIQFAYELDPHARLAQVAPGKALGRSAADNELPVADPREERQGGRGLLASHLRLESAHQVATILTIVPGAPNDERRLHEEIVEPAEAFKALGIDSAPPCDGPEWEIRIGAQLETARFAWRDDNAAAVEDLLGLTGSNPGGTARLGEPVNKDRLRALAVANAAALYARFVDRHEGELHTALSPGIRPTGSIAAVTHTLDPNSGATTEAILPTEVDAEDPIALMPESIRRQILGLVDIHTGSP